VKPKDQKGHAFPLTTHSVDGNFYTSWVSYLRRKTMAILEISVVPIGTGDTSLSAYVADCLRVLKKAKVHYELSSMGTNIEGNLKDLFKIAFQMHQTPFRKGALRVLTTIKIDDRRDKKGTLKGKKRAVQEKLRVSG
jgi:uncharacterized protein (TIGR00106 family)